MEEIRYNVYYLHREKEILVASFKTFKEAYDYVSMFKDRILMIKGEK